MSHWNLSRKKALITGGSKGIGLATALQMAELGAEVCIVARHAAEIATALEQLQSIQPLAWAIVGDVSTPEDRQRILDALGKRWEALDILVNNVGMNIRKPFSDYAETEYRQVFETNLFSAMALTQLALPWLQKSPKGSVVNVASVAGQVDVRSGAPYGMTKAALIQMTRHLAVEWAPLGIRVNAVSPWYTRTPLAEPVLNQPERLELIVKNTPLGRVAEASEVASAITFLAMDQASYITGQNLVVDGGFMAQGL